MEVAEPYVSFQMPVTTAGPPLQHTLGSYYCNRSPISGDFEIALMCCLLVVTGTIWRQSATLKPTIAEQKAHLTIRKLTFYPLLLLSFFLHSLILPSLPHPHFLFPFLPASSSLFTGKEAIPAEEGGRGIGQGQEKGRNIRRSLGRH